MIRFSAFAPVLCTVESEGGPKPVLSFVATSHPQAVIPRASPLDEIHAIEDEWHQRIQPSGLVEQTLCAQLAHATWHLRCLHRAEREAILAAAANRGINGESAASLMTWRRSAEAAIRNALEQLESYRKMNQREHAAAIEPCGAGDLFALAEAVSGVSVGTRAHASSRSA